MKKTFNKPEIAIVAIQAQESILAGSQAIQSGGGNGNGGPTSADARQVGSVEASNPSGNSVSAMELN